MRPEEREIHITEKSIKTGQRNPELLQVLTIRARHGTLTCICGRRYQRYQALNKHKTGCEQWNLTEQFGNSREPSFEGNIHILIVVMTLTEGPDLEIQPDEEEDRSEESETRSKNAQTFTFTDV